MMLKKTRRLIEQVVAKNQELKQELAQLKQQQASTSKSIAEPTYQADQVAFQRAWKVIADMYKAVQELYQTLNANSEIAEQKKQIKIFTETHQEWQLNPQDRTLIENYVRKNCT